MIEGAKEEFIDIVANGGGIYVVSYYFGGKYVCLLVSELLDSAAHGQAPSKDEEAGMAKAGSSPLKISKPSNRPCHSCVSNKTSCSPMTSARQGKSR